MELTNSNIQSIAIAPYKRAFTVPFHTGSFTLSAREGSLVRVEMRDGKLGYGEAAPLAPFSRDSISMVTDYLAQTTKASLLHDWITLAPALPPSLRMAMDGAMADAGADAISPSSTAATGCEIQALESNAVLPIEDLEISLRRFQDYWDRGFRVFKVKISPTSAETSLQIIGKIKSVAKESYKIRLDSNGSFTPNSILLVADALRSYPVEYWEDPLPIDDHYSFLFFKKECHIPIALDQPVRSLEDLQFFLEGGFADYFILKPTVLGGLRNTSLAIQKVLERRKRYTITSALEVESGVRSLVRFCLEQAPNVVHGLATSNLFGDGFTDFFPRARITSVTPPTTAENAWLDSLSWKTLP